MRVKIFIIGIKKEQKRYDLIFCEIPRRILYGFGYVNKEGYLISYGLSRNSGFFETKHIYNQNIVAEKLGISIIDAEPVSEIINRILNQ